MTWRKFSLLMWKDSGALLDIELLRALEWLATTGSAPGEMIHLDLEEMERRSLLEDFHEAYPQTPEGTALAQRLALKGNPKSGLVITACRR